MRLLALGKDRAARLAAHPLVDALQRRGDRIAARRQLSPIGFQVDYRPLSDAGIHRRLGDGDRHVGEQPGVERHGNDVFGAEARAVAAIGSRHFVGHILSRQRCKSLGGSDLHGVIDGRSAHVERTAEDMGKAEDIVDLVGIVGAAGHHDGVLADSGDLFRGDFRIRIGHGEDDRIVGHGAHHVLGQRPLDRQAEEHVGAGNRFGEAAVLRGDGMGRLPLVHALFAALVDHSLGITKRDVFGRKTHRLDELHAGDRGSAGAIADELCRLRSRLVRCRALIRPATAMIAVPCWSS